MYLPLSVNMESCCYKRLIFSQGMEQWEDLSLIGYIYFCRPWYIGNASLFSSCWGNGNECKSHLRMGHKTIADRIPEIFMVEDEEKFKKAGCSHYLPKPFHKEQLHDLMRYILSVSVNNYVTRKFIRYKFIIISE